MLGLIAYFNKQRIVQYFMQPTESKLETKELTVDPQEPEESEKIVAENLRIPWEIAFLPDGTMLVTERPGTLKHITENTTAVNVEGVVHRGEGGLLGMALHPNFKNNKYIYLYSTTSTEGKLTNRVERYVYENEKLSDRKTIIENIPGSNNHDGGRIAFGPDGLLYIATAVAEGTNTAQDKNSLAGKILRIKDDGSIPADNPFGNATYSYGHRNPQGLAWDDSGQLWATEHGPSGRETGQDELNRIQKGQNYGWPTITGDEFEACLVKPVALSVVHETWAPAGLADYQGNVIYS